MIEGAILADNHDQMLYRRAALTAPGLANNIDGAATTIAIKVAIICGRLRVDTLARSHMHRSSIDTLLRGAAR